MVFGAQADMDPFGTWEWVRGTTLHFQGFYGPAQDAFQAAIWPAFALMSHPTSVFAPPLDHILIDHG